jgi:ABC-2 type transport system ATP-binding protein
MVGLDPRGVRLVKDLLRANAAAGQTIFMSTHLLSIAEEIADRVGIVNHGRLRFLGTLDELRAKRDSRDASLERLYLDFIECETPPGDTQSDEASAAAGHAAPAIREDSEG